jgi:TetR/AcrR family transcriptional repressor of nem operon
MRRSREDKAKTHARIVELASGRIREQGLDGPGVAEIMKMAGLTHGGFYKHFGSRDDLIAEAADHAFAYGGQTLEKAANEERDPFDAWVDWYVSEERRDEPGALRCPVAALVGDVGRADDRVRAGYSAVFERYIEVLQGMLGGGEHSRRQALITASTLLGALALSRAVDDETLSREILSSARESLRDQHARTQ